MSAAHLLAWAWAFYCIAKCCTKQLLGAAFSIAVSDVKAGLGAAVCVVPVLDAFRIGKGK